MPFDKQQVVDGVPLGEGGQQAVPPAPISQSPVKEPPSKKAKPEPAEAPQSNANLEQGAPQGDVGGEPPLVMRVDQWAQKPKAKAKATAKCKASSKAKAKTGPKKKGETIEVLESGDESLQEEEKPAAEAKVKAKGRKRACSNQKGAPKAKAKAKAKGKEGKAASEDEKDEKDAAKPDGKQEPPIKYEPVNEDGKNDINTAFQWDQGQGVTNGDGSGASGDAPGDDPGAAPGDDPGASEPAAGKLGKKSFARRPPPKTSPSKDRFIAIRDIFESRVGPHVRSLGMPVYQWEAGEFYSVEFQNNGTFVFVASFLFQ